MCEDSVQILAMVQLRLPRALRERRGTAVEAGCGGPGRPRARQGERDHRQQRADPEQRSARTRPISPGTYRVAPGHVWLLSSYSADSWDSRYLGPVPVTEIRGVARPVWVFR
jgi:hypothetical protein